MEMEPEHVMYTYSYCWDVKYTLGIYVHNTAYVCDFKFDDRSNQNNTIYLLERR